MPPVALAVCEYAVPTVPFDSVAGFTVIAAFTVTLYAWEPVAPTVSVPVIVKFVTPAVVGVPVIAPVVAFRDSPAGNAPAVTAKVEAPVPPVTLTVWLKAVPTVAAGKVAGVTVIVAFTTTEYACDVVAPTVSVAPIVKLNVPAADVVPVIAPVAAFRDKPVGNEPADTLYVGAPVPPDAETLWLYATPCVVAGSEAGEIDITALIVTLYARDPVDPRLSFAVIVKLNVPAADGVPVIAPVDAFNDSPVGNAPALMANVYGAVPPDAVTVWLYATPCVQCGSVAGLTVNVTVLTVKLYAVDPVAPRLSVAVIVKLNEPEEVGVPVIEPVDVFNDRPLGKLPAETL